MSDKTSFFLTNTSAIQRLQLVEIYHPDFDYYRFQRNNVDESITVKHVDEIDYTYEYQLFEVSRGNSTNDLDQKISITFADYNDELMLSINDADPKIRPTIVYREYRSDDLNSPMVTLQTLQIVNVNKDGSGMVTFDASVEALNNVKTGDAYTLDRFQTLKGVI